MLLFFIVGLAVMGLGIFAKVHGSRMYKCGITHAVVRECQPAVKQIGATQIPCSEITLEIPTAYGVVYKSIKDNRNYNVGDTVDVLYNPQNDTIEFPKNVSAPNSKGPYLLIGFGAMICILLVLLEIGKHSKAFNDGLILFLSYFLAVGLIFGGVFLAFIRPARRKKQMVSCRKVNGKQVDYNRRRGNNNGYTYTPIYEFYHNGEMVRIEGEIGGNGSKYRQIGRNVTIVINDETGEMYCLDDVASIKKATIFIIIFGIGVLGILIARDLFGCFN